MQRKGSGGGPVVERCRLGRGHARALGGVREDPRAVGDLAADAERHEQHERRHDGQLHVGPARAQVDAQQRAAAAKQPIAPMLMMLSLGMLLGAAMMKFLL